MAKAQNVLNQFFNKFKLVLTLFLHYLLQIPFYLVANKRLQLEMAQLCQFFLAAQVFVVFNYFAMQE